MKNLCRTFGTALTLCLGASLVAVNSHAAKSDILFVLDGSGSMWGQIEGTAKIQTAKDTMIRLMDDVPADASLGLMTYGTTSKESCDDVTMLNAIGSDRNAIKESIKGLRPLGKTPIQNSLVNGISILQNAQPSDVPKSLVLVSDGLETCDGNPCAVATTSQFRNVSMKIHVVGFDVDAETREQLECIAREGKGQYFDASDTEGFKNAMEAVVKVAQAETVAEPEPEAPAGPLVEEVFRDDFDGDALAEHWSVYNPDDSAYIVDGGELLVVAATEEPFFGDETVPNRFDLDFDLPKGDWDIEVKFRMEYQQYPQEVLFIGSPDEKNSIYGFFITGRNVSEPRPMIYAVRRSAGKEPVQQNLQVMTGLEDLTTSSDEEARKHVLNDQTLTLTFMKRSRNYSTKINFVDGNGQDTERETDPVTQLRGPKKVSMLFNLDSYSGQPTGDSTAFIDSVVIRSVK